MNEMFDFYSHETTHYKRSAM